MRPQVPSAGEIGRFGDLGREPHEPHDVELVRHPLEIRLDLRAGGVFVAPLGIRGERVGVDVRGNVAREARVAILSPRSAQARGFLVDDDVVVPVFEQPNRA